jgi:hypothetical protein
MGCDLNWLRLLMDNEHRNGEGAAESARHFQHQPLIHVPAPHDPIQISMFNVECPMFLPHIQRFEFWCSCLWFIHF